MKAAIFGSRLQENNQNYWQDISQVLSKYNIQVDHTYFDTPLDKERENPHIAYDKLKKILQKADVVVVENTYYSTGIGLIIGRVIELNKPMLILFNTSVPDSGAPSILVKAHSKNKKIYFKEYSNKSDLEEALVEFVKGAKELLNTKFLFNLSPEMARYLQWGSETYNRPMVDILRELIDERMEADQEWQKYISQDE